MRGRLPGGIVQLVLRGITGASPPDRDDGVDHELMGGVVSAAVLTPVLFPVIYELWRGRSLPVDPVGENINGDVGG